MQRFGRDKGADIPVATDYVNALAPLLGRYGSEPGLTIILFTPDEGSYSRELAPLEGDYSALRIGPPWWFNASPAGLRRFRPSHPATAHRTSAGKGQRATVRVRFGGGGIL